jgi:hypothetical protein
MWCGGGHLHKECPEEGNAASNTDMLQLQVGGRRGTSTLQLSRLQPRQGKDAKDKVAGNAKKYIVKGVLFQPHYPRTVLGGAAQQQQQPHPSPVAQACPADLAAQPRTNAKSVSSES